MHPSNVDYKKKTKKTICLACYGKGKNSDHRFEKKKIPSVSHHITEGL
jgi:hypothetical protein